MRRKKRGPRVDTRIQRQVDEYKRGKKRKTKNKRKIRTKKAAVDYSIQMPVLSFVSFVICFPIVPIFFSFFIFYCTLFRAILLVTQVDIRKSHWSLTVWANRKERTDEREKKRKKEKEVASILISNKFHLSLGHLKYDLCSCLLYPTDHFYP